MLHELELALGQPLFDRVGRGLQLNAAGERVTAHSCRRIRTRDASQRTVEGKLSASELVANLVVMFAAKLTAEPEGVLARAKR